MIELQADGGIQVGSFLVVTTAILVLFLGKGLNRRIGLLLEYNIPEPVTGGLLVAMALFLVHLATSYRVTFDLGIRDVLLVYFFTTIGINARIADLKAGGWPLVILLVSVSVFMLFQNSLVIAASTFLDRPPALGLLAGSISLLGGHGTAIAWAPTFAAKYGIDNALEIGVLCATGLVLASVGGGPLARFLVKHHHLAGPADDTPTVGVHYGEAQPRIDYFSFLRAILAIHVCGIVGILVQQMLARIGFTLPLFVPCLLAGIVLTNLIAQFVPRVPWPSRSPALALIAELSLGVFVAMSLMSMQLWALVNLAGPLFLLLALQVALAVAFAMFAIFRLLGRSYDANSARDGPNGCPAWKLCASTGSYGCATILWPVSCSSRCSCQWASPTPSPRACPASTGCTQRSSRSLPMPWSGQAASWYSDQTPRSHRSSSPWSCRSPAVIPCMPSP
jgi:ESS family glutamate:Na+ symporter